jgi:hypothetical protein
MGVEKGHELYDFLRQESESMASEYNRIRARTREDPGTAGDEGEGNWAALLRQWLPAHYHVRTKGRILATMGQASHQVDLLVLKPSYPPCLLDKKLYLASGVSATFECKTTLKADHIETACKNAATLRRLLPNRYGTPYRELHSPVIFGLLSHSHIWTSPGSKPLENIGSALVKADKKEIGARREMLDSVCVADCATWTAHKELFRGPGSFADRNAPMTSYNRHFSPGQDGGTAPLSTPISVFIADLLTRMAREDDQIRDIATYFLAVGLIGRSEGKIRKWPLETLSNDLRETLLSGDRPALDLWSEWYLKFPD